MKTHVIPWMSEEETERFLAEIRSMNPKLKQDGVESPARVQTPFGARTQNADSAQMSIGGL
jgi:hypothetical protein